jgi:phenylalanyl-tRNA synthetase beta chain
VLEIVAQNSRFQERIAIFEVGNIYLESEEGVLPDELLRLAVAMTGVRAPAHWRDAQEPAMMDFFDLKGVLQMLFNALGLDVTYEPVQHPTYRPGYAARLKLGDQVVGTMGALHPRVVEQYHVRANREQPVLSADIDLETLLANVPATRVFAALSPYPAVREDLALVVDSHLAEAEVAAALRQAGGFLLKDVVLFDVYEGKQIPAGKRSLAYHLTFQAPDRTLTDKDVSKQRSRILQQLERNLGAQLR